MVALPFVLLAVITYTNRWAHANLTFKYVNFDHFYSWREYKIVAYAVSGSHYNQWCKYKKMRTKTCYSVFIDDALSKQFCLFSATRISTFSAPSKE